jgi:hypothetical protein
MSMDMRGETLRVVTGPFSIWRTPTLGAHLQVHDGTGSRITLTRVLAVGALAGGLRKGTGHVSIAVYGRDGQMKMVQVKPSKAQEVLTWAFEFTAWNEAQHRQMNLPYPPAMAAPQA